MPAESQCVAIVARLSHVAPIFEVMLNWYMPETNVLAPLSVPMSLQKPLKVRVRVVNLLPHLGLRQCWEVRSYFAATGIRPAARFFRMRRSSNVI